jgi:uncharacterized protein
MPIVDTNVYLSRWPFRRLKLDETPELVAKLRGHEVIQAWVGSFDGLLHKDIAGVNTRLAEECRRHGSGFLLPFGTVNPMLPDWREDLRRCHEEHKMPGIRLHPNYHGYKLDSPLFLELLRDATARHLIVQMAVLMEDRRTQHPLVLVPRIELEPLPRVIQQVPGLRLQLLNCFQALRGELLLKTMSAGEVRFEIAMLEGVGGVTNLIGQIPPSRVMFGSYSPFFIFDAALLKLKESPLSEEHARVISSANAERWIPTHEK